MGLLEVMDKDTGYTLEELSSIIGWSQTITETEIMRCFQEGKLKIKQVGKDKFYAIKEDEGSE